PGRTHERIDDVAHSERELLHSTAHAGPDNRPFQIHLRLRERGLGTSLLSREKRRNALLGSLLRSGRGGNRPEAPLPPDFEPLDFTKCHVTRIPSLQLSFGLQFVHCLLVRASGFLDLTVSFCDIRPGYNELRLDLGNLSSRGLSRSFLLGAVEPE